MQKKRKKENITLPLSLLNFLTLIGITQERTENVSCFVFIEEKSSAVRVSPVEKGEKKNRKRGRLCCD